MKIYVIASWRNKHHQETIDVLSDDFEVYKYHGLDSGFYTDFEAMRWADVCVLMLPASQSSHLEAGWFVGKGKFLVIYNPEKIKLKWAYKLGKICVSIGEIATELRLYEEFLSKEKG